MARILFLHIRYPEFDRCSGDLRVTQMLGLLARRHQVSLHVLHQPAGYLAAPANRAYAERLAAPGVRTTAGSLLRQLRREHDGAIVVEFWHAARPIVGTLRALQPQARRVVDIDHVYSYGDSVRAQALSAEGDATERAVLVESAGIHSRTVPQHPRAVAVGRLQGLGSRPAASRRSRRCCPLGTLTSASAPAAAHNVDGQSPSCWRPPLGGIEQERPDGPPEEHSAWHGRSARCLRDRALVRVSEARCQVG